MAASTSYYTGWLISMGPNLCTITNEKLPCEEWPTSLSELVAEIVTVKVALPATKDDVEVTAADEQLPQGDEEDRHVAVENLAKSDAGREDAEAAVSDGAPRIDAPEVADNAAVPENTPGYFAMASPKIFPFGGGDYHECRQPMQGPTNLLLTGDGM